MPGERSYNPLVMMALIGGVVFVFAFFLGMLFHCNLKSSPNRLAPGTDRQLPAIVPDLISIPERSEIRLAPPRRTAPEPRQPKQSTQPAVAHPWEA